MDYLIFIARIIIYFQKNGDLIKKHGLCLGQMNAAIKRQKPVAVARTNFMEEIVIPTRLCCVCLENEKSTGFMQCAHLCMCTKCALKFKEKNIKKCPLCRIDNQEMKTFFV